MNEPRLDDKGDLYRRELTMDDRQGLSAIYPAASDPGTCDESTASDYYPKPVSGAARSGCSVTSAAGSVAAYAWLLLLALLLLARRRVRVAEALVLLMLLTTLPARAYVLYTSPDNPDVPLRWFERSADVWFDPGAPGDIAEDAARHVVQASYEVWSNLACSGVSEPFGFGFPGSIVGQEIGYDPDKENANIVWWVNNPNDWDHGATVLALTSLTYDTHSGEIVDGDLELNDAEFTYSTDADKYEADLANTVVHETGHFLGLDHSLNVQATMYAKAPLGEKKKRDLHQDDIDGYCALYGPEAAPLPGTPVPSDPPGGGSCTAGGGGAKGTASPQLLLLGCALVWLLRRSRPTKNAAPAR